MTPSTVGGPGPWQGGGFLLVDKPSGPTSHDIVAQARRGLRTRKVGHTGTLDPFASGLLVLCVGKATRLAEYVVGMDKEYEAVVRMGRLTDSHDRDGETVSEDEVWRSLDENRVREAADRLTGVLDQLPPRLSAIKIRGVPAHRRVRSGEAVEMKTRKVTINRFQLVGFEPPDVSFEVSCSSGTYVRSLARDLGEDLGTGCHLDQLRRTKVGALSVDHAVGLDDLADGKTPDGAWVTPSEVLWNLPRVSVDSAEALHLAQGKVVNLEGLPDGEVAAFLDGEEFVAIGRVEGSVLRPRKVFWNG